MLIWKKSGERLTYTADVRARAEPEPSEEPTPSQWLPLDVGAELRLKVPHLMRVASSDPRLVGVTVFGDEVRIEGKEPGRVTILTWESGGKRNAVGVDVRRR